ncbi:hypothetical protein VTK26DRAFT_1396 [Humicola hyalothermophila]
MLPPLFLSYLLLIVPASAHKLYVDGGLMNRKPYSEASQNLSNPFLVWSDLNDSALGMPTLHANLSKNATIPSRSGGALWQDSVNKRLYLYGGEAYSSPPTSFRLYAYDILYDEWDSFGPPTGAAAIIPTSYGASVSIPARGEAYYYGGWHNNASVPGWTGPPQASNRLIQYTMDSNTWSNLTGPDGVGRAEGTMDFIPIGDAGMLVYFGGTRDEYQNGTLIPEPLDTIYLYDVATGSASYIYGGAGFPPGATGYDDIYVLTIPSFQWIRGPYPFNSNVSGPYPKSMQTCNIANNAQMLVISGHYSNNTTFTCDVESVWGEHNMNLGQDNPEGDIWAEYYPALTTYTVPTFIRTAIGGEGTGGADVSTPVFALRPDDARGRPFGDRTPTRDVPLPTAADPTDDHRPPSSPALGAGAIAGISVGGTIAAIALLVAAPHRPSTAPSAPARSPGARLASDLRPTGCGARLVHVHVHAAGHAASRAAVVAAGRAVRRGPAVSGDEGRERQPAELLAAKVVVSMTARRGHRWRQGRGFVPRRWIDPGTTPSPSLSHSRTRAPRSVHAAETWRGEGGPVPGMP